MKRTSSMTFKNTAEAQELAIYIENTYRLYELAKCTIKALVRKAQKGIYDSNKAVDAWYYTATTGSNMYEKEFGYNFSVQDRFSAAVLLEERYREDVLSV